MARDLLNRDRLMEYGSHGIHAGLGTLNGFKKFILRGNVVDLAVGIVIGAAFNGLIQGFVNDFLQPLIGIIISAITGNRANNLNDYTAGPFHWGHFIGILITFLLTALVVYYLIVLPMNALRDRYDGMHPKPDDGPKNRECPFCLSTVPLKATRCAYCTAQLPPADAPATQRA